MLRPSSRVLRRSSQVLLPSSRVLLPSSRVQLPSSRVLRRSSQVLISAEVAAEFQLHATAFGQGFNGGSRVANFAGVAVPAGTEEADQRWGVLPNR